MSCIRDRVEIYNASCESVKRTILIALKRKYSTYRYVDTALTSENVIKTLIKPYIWTLLLSTSLTIVIEPDVKGCKVTAQTKSQDFIGGDIFNFYNRYLNRLFGDINDNLQKNGPEIA